MKIGIDARMYEESGIGRYLRNLISELQRIDRTNEYFILLKKPDYDKVKLASPRFHKVLADFGWYGFKEQWNLPGVLAKYRFDLVHFPHFNVPLLYGGKFVVTIHDLIHQHYSGHSSALKKYGYKKAFSFALRKSEAVISPTQFVKKQLINEWRVDSSKITVTHEGVDRSISKLVLTVKEKDFKNLSKKYEITSDYLFYIGNAHPHKNIKKLISVFQQVRILHPNLQLVLSGKENQFWRQELNESNLSGVVYTGIVSDSEAVTLYKNALAFVMPSLEEGFGIPILEAMECSCPVICSEIEPLQEVGGDAVFTFNPMSEDDMRSKIIQVVENARLRAILKQKGAKRVKSFSWERLAKETLKVYQDANRTSAR